MSNHQKVQLSMVVNSNPVSLEIEPTETLLQVLREKLGLKGTKQGCNLCNCGACTVLLDGRPIYACSKLAIQANGSKILTIEGLAPGNQLHPLQHSFIEHGAFQCGYCTPGMLLSASALLDENPSPDREEIRKAISGNLCRCTGYQQILDAIQAASRQSGG